MLRTPKQLTKTLQASIIGQDTGVRTIATAIAAHLVRINHNRRDPEHPIKKTMYLLLDPLERVKVKPCARLYESTTCPFLW